MINFYLEHRLSRVCSNNRQLVETPYFNFPTLSPSELKMKNLKTLQSSKKKKKNVDYIQKFLPKNYWIFKRHIYVTIYFPYLLFEVTNNEVGRLDLKTRNCLNKGSFINIYSIVK